MERQTVPTQSPVGFSSDWDCGVVGRQSCTMTAPTRIQMFQSIGYIPVYLIFEMQPIDKYHIVFFLRIGRKKLIRSHPVGQKRKILF